MNKYAVTHPGKIGDALYALPTIRYIYNHTGSKVDFYTSSYCRPLKGLFEYQSCIDRVIISEDYVIERMDMGVQPYSVPVPLGEYVTTFHLGFRRVPNKRLDWFMAESVGIDTDQLPPIYYEFQDYQSYLPDNYYVLAARGETSYKDTFLDFIRASNYPVVQIGGNGEFISDEDIKDKTIDCTGYNFMETVSMLSKAKGFVGLMSSQLVLANGFDIAKIAPHNGRSWDMRHVVYSNSNYYPVDPSGEQILNIIEIHNAAKG